MSSQCCVWCATEDAVVPRPVQLCGLRRRDGGGTGRSLAGWGAPAPADTEEQGSVLCRHGKRRHTGALIGRHTVTSSLMIRQRHGTVGPATNATVVTSVNSRRENILPVSLERI